MLKLKDVLKEVQDRSFETISEVFATNPNPAVRRLVSFANMALDEIVKAHEWSWLKREHRLTASDEEVVDGKKLYPMPSDFDRLISDTAYEENSYYEFEFPESDQIFALLANSSVGTVRRRGRFFNGKIELLDTPASDMLFTYITNSFVKINDQTFSQRFVTDNDTLNVPDSRLDELLIRGVTAMYHTGKQSASAQTSIELFKTKLAQQIKADTGARTINDLHKASRPMRTWKRPNAS